MKQVENHCPDPLHLSLFLFESSPPWLLPFCRWCFLSLDLVFVLCLSVINTARLGSWVASVPFVSGDSEWDFQENPEEGRARVPSPSLWGLTGGKLCDLWGSHFILWAWTSNFYQQMGLLKLTTFSELPDPHELRINSCVAEAVLGRVDTGKK